MDTAVADVELLRSLDANGDDFSIPRDVEFLMPGPSAEKASIVAGFINDYQYGLATADQLGEIHRVLVVVHMPIQQHNISCVSGFMACVSLLYGLEYDGWDALLRSASDANLGWITLEVALRCAPTTTRQAKIQG
ncbi:ribonuclease E inhibitor RraB [Burkholderia pyrrocinia]|nr:ribonuclease E inhibitor RraB [Burkholderia pyrrocinia]